MKEFQFQVDILLSLKAEFQTNSAVSAHRLGFPYPPFACYAVVSQSSVADAYQICERAFMLS